MTQLIDFTLYHVTQLKDRISRDTADESQEVGSRPGSFENICDYRTFFPWHFENLGLSAAFTACD